MLKVVFLLRFYEVSMVMEEPRPLICQLAMYQTILNTDLSKLVQNCIQNTGSLVYWYTEHSSNDEHKIVNLILYFISIHLM